MVSPRRLLPGYQVRLSRQEMAPLALAQPQQAKVLVIVGRNDRSITLNLKAPLLINLDQRLGRQVLNNADQPVQYELQTLQPLEEDRLMLQRREAANLEKADDRYCPHEDNLPACPDARHRSAACRQ